jgi:hypothetical protein
MISIRKQRMTSYNKIKAIWTNRIRRVELDRIQLGMGATPIIAAEKLYDNQRASTHGAQKCKRQRVLPHSLPASEYRRTSVPDSF